MLKHLKLLWIFSQKSPHSLYGSVAYVLLRTEIRHSLIQSFDNNLALIFLHPQDNNIKCLHNGIDDDTVFKVLSKLVHHIPKVLFTAIYLHQLNFA